jgi:deoxyribodipyrimidine photo-lyase
MNDAPITLFWFRRDLRLEDNAGLYYALKQFKNVVPVFIFDTDILMQLPNKADRRVDYIHQALQALQQQLVAMGTSIRVYHGKPVAVFEKLLQTQSIAAIICNKDYEPNAISRDHQVAMLAQANTISFLTYKDQVIFEQAEIVKDDGLPYTVFTPFSKKWKNKLNPYYLKPYPSLSYIASFLPQIAQRIPSLADIGFEQTGYVFAPPMINESIIQHYAEQRDYPALSGTTELSVHLRFGTISIRKLAAIALRTNETWLNELIWREFYMAILFHFPHVATRSFKPQYDKIIWRNNEQEFQAWCQGQTGYPIVDAGMRALNATGFMHNRVRMIVASFLTKHLLIDWRWGEAYFAEKLIDFDLSANNGGWQWAAGSGCDAAPYFRIFNPYEQTKKFDKDLTYIRKWVPEFEEFSYPSPIVDHKFARERVLSTYKNALQD